MIRVFEMKDTFVAAGPILVNLLLCPLREHMIDVRDLKPGQETPFLGESVFWSPSHFTTLLLDSSNRTCELFEWGGADVE